ncbi:hypothetical protein VK792_08715 [Mesobacterium sp. TK19101]|uniref:Uncharacterized protein n=1 Tax=Mesobacterium hydrothermale TaxID=3111907 RepID=A0ABU6HJQ9_9RHOB|nr:hypothetical protein [Mesobacterium sp. TK19101]MEC3861365.1 hypothetical protein [Mesobacterium sp. TK19101]
MTLFTLTPTRLREGIWDGEIAGTDSDLRVSVSHMGQRLDGVELTKTAPGAWALRVPIPATAISDGVQTFVVCDADGMTLGSFAIVAGDVLAHDLRAEIDLLRTELDMLKRAFRQHCADSA